MLTRLLHIVSDGQNLTLKIFEIKKKFKIRLGIC